MVESFEYRMTVVGLFRYLGDSYIHNFQIQFLVVTVDKCALYRQSLDLGFARD